MTSLTPRSIRALLSEHGVAPSRALGQHFLADPNIARRIVVLAELSPTDRVLEIGPGLGSLTVALAASGAAVLALELDRHLLPVLEAVVEGMDVRVEIGDAMKIDLEELLGRDRWICVSNLPYNVATPLVMRLLAEVPQIDRMVVMVQREVGERLAAEPGNRTYGAVTVKAAYYAAVRIVAHVPPSVFVPRPKVDSVVIRLDRHVDPPVEVPSVAALFGLVQAGFSQRRKMLRRALEPALGPRTHAVLDRAGVPETSRAEQLDLQSWAALARAAAAAA